jgi:hypothetical protein
VHAVIGTPRHGTTVSFASGISIMAVSQLLGPIASRVQP